MPTVSDPLDRIAIALRLWAGCLAAAKLPTRREAGRMRRRSERRSSQASTQCSSAFVASRSPSTAFPKDHPFRRYT
jgi:hypothetical protein